MTSVADPLLGPDLKVGRAKCHINELEALVGCFLAKNPYEIVEKQDPQTGQNRAWVKIHADPAPEWSPIIGDILHNLRSALDILYCQLLRKNGVTPKGSDLFPIRDTKTVFDKDAGPAIRKRAGRRAFEAFRDTVKPYRGGNNALWCLHKLNIVDKHNLLLVVGAANPTIIVSIVDDIGNVLLSHPYPTTSNWPLKDGDELPAGTPIGEAHYGDAPKTKMKAEATFAVTLYEPTIIGIPEALDVSLANMTGAVEHTIGVLGALL
jgi:hypothetical protein